jgi:hypothetical protein
MQFGNACIVAAAFIGLVGGPAAAQEAVGMKLEDAGFIMREANTPEKMARLRLLPPHKFITRTNAGQRYFVYADPTYCKCAFVGTPAAMQAYRNMARPPPTNLPGVSPGALGAPRASGNLTRDEVFQDMDNDLGIPVPEGDIFDYRF